MDSSDVLSTCNSNEADNEKSNSRDHNISEDFVAIREQAIANLQKPNLPNVNVPEKIIICLDICYDNHNSFFRLGDGTTFTPVNMLKRILDFFLYSKHAINKKTEFALLLLKDKEACWIQNCTNNIREVINVIDYLNSEQSTSETFDFYKVFQILQEQDIHIPEYKAEDCVHPPPYIVRMLVLYGRSNCIPQIPQDDPYLNFLKKQMYFYIDILLAHEEDCALNKCEEIYDALQDLDNGYSYVYEVSRNATKIHDYIAKLLAHPLQRPLQKNTNYSFGYRY